MLTIIQVGHVEASDRYIRNKMKAIREAGLEVELMNLPEDCTTDDIVYRIWNCTSTALMVQLPLPEHIDVDLVLRSIPMDKDIDGLNPYSDYKPLTPCAIMRWFDEHDIELERKTVAILGRSDLVGKPLANMMIEVGATVTVMNSKTPPHVRESLCAYADIIISAVGKCDTITGNHLSLIKPQIIIDVGINRDKNGKLCGDVSASACKHVNIWDGYCSPVPGGVGKWTVRELVLRLQEMEDMYTHTHEQEDMYMYINPFFAGVLTTIGVEVTVLFVAATVAAIRRIKKSGKH